VRLLEEADDVRLTVPVNPFTGDTVIVDEAEVPTVMVTLVGLADTVKSLMVELPVAV